MEGRNTPSPKLDAPTDNNLLQAPTSDAARRRAVISPRTVMGDSRASVSSPRTVMGDARTFIVEKELLESQMRKIQMENTTLQTENKLLKDKYNRATARISELESQLSSLEEELDSAQETLASEMTRVSRQVRAECDRELEQKQNKMAALSKDNSKLQSEIRNLERKLDSSAKEIETIKKSSDRTKVVEAHKEENGALKLEIKKLQELLSASEQQLDKECQKSIGLGQQLTQVTEVADLLQLQLDAGGSTGSAAEKRVLSLEQRLRVTEERLTQERADRANNLSQVEEKLLTDNAKLQASEKELIRQLQREKDKNRSLEQRSHEYREENMKLRLSLPDEDDNASPFKNHDIPNTSRTSQRQQSKKGDSVNVQAILKELEREGVGEGEAAAVIWLWNQRLQQQGQLREWSVYLSELQLADKDTSQGLKLLREKLTEYENKFKELQEKMDDVQAEKVTIDSTYKQQLSILVKERHDAFARLKTLEDLMEALRKENELLRQGLATTATPADNKVATGSEAQLESLSAEIQTLESRASQLIRKNQALEMEIDTLRAQVAARDIALEEAYAEVKAAQAQRSESAESSVLKDKIESLSNELSEAQQELRSSQQRAEGLQRDRQRLEGEVEETQRLLKIAKTRQAKQTSAKEDSKDSKAAILENELEQKDMQLLTLNSHLRQLEVELETTQHQLLAQRETTSALEVQVEENEVELQQKAAIVDSVTEKRLDMLEQLTLVKTQLDSSSLTLSQKNSQIQVMQMELAHERERANLLEERVQQLRREEAGEGPQSEAARDLHTQELDSEIVRLRADLVSASSRLGSVQEEREVESQQSGKVREELINAQAVTCQLTTQAANLEQELETLSQDHVCVSEERQQAEEHLVKMEARLQEVLHKFELEAKREHNDFTTEYAELTPEDGPKILSELHTLRLLTGEKDKEVGMLEDKISRQQTQARNQEKRVETLRSAQAGSKDDINRLTKEMMIKMKETAATAEVNQILSKEQAALQKENQRLALSMEDERAHQEKRKTHFAEVIKKVERSELSKKESSQLIQQKDSLVADMEAEVRQVKRNLGQMEVENEQLKVKVEHLNEDIRNLGNVNTTLEKRLEMERASLAEERDNALKRREDLATVNHKTEELKHEQTMLLNNLALERKNVQKLKEELQEQEEVEKKLQGQIQSLNSDIETQHGQLLACRQQIEQLKVDKEAFYKDYQDVCRQLGEKDHLLTEQQRQSERDVEGARTEIERLLSSQDKERGNLELDIVKTREELNEKKDQLRQKELQLTTFGRTLQDLEDTTRAKKDLEAKVERLESSADESRLLLESMRREMLSLRESNTQLQDSLSQKQMAEGSLQDQLRGARESGEAQTIELRHMMEGMKAHHDFEKKALRESIQQLESSLKTSEGDLSSSLDKQTSLREDNRDLQYRIDSLSIQLSEETAAHRLTQNKLDTLKAQVNDVKMNQFSSEEKLLELQASVARLEADIAVERDRNRAMACELQEAEGAVEAKNMALKGKHEQIEVLKNEVSKLQQVLESQKQQLSAHLRKSTLDLKQQVETTESERLKLAYQAQQMSVELEQVREQLALKNKENLKLQEEMVGLKDQVNEHSSRLRTTQVSLQHEEEMQTKLNNRFQEQEEELRKLRAFLSGKAEEEGDGKTMWKEVNRVMQDLSRQLLKHMDEVRNSERDGRSRDSKQIHQLKRELNALDSQLNAERALHAITKNAMNNLDEDCTRLRQQLHALRRKGYTTERKQKNRMEEINAIIARSQTRAQAMMGSNYLDGTFRHIHPSRDFNAASGSGEASPDTSLALSDASFSSAGIFNNSFLNLSGTFLPATPRK